MKKTYTKPVAYIEEFSISQSIAANCSAMHNGPLGTPNSGDINSCGWNMGNIVVWSAKQNCTFTLDVDTPYQGVCYNNPNGGASIFNS